MARQRLVRVLAMLSLSAILVTTVSSASGRISMRRQVMASGGGYASSDHFALVGTIGQPVTGYTAGTSRALVAGYWSGYSASAKLSEQIFLPLAFRP